MNTYPHKKVISFRRKNTFQLLVALSRDSEGASWNGVANGSLYLDDSISQSTRQCNYLNDSNVDCMKKH